MFLLLLAFACICYFCLHLLAFACIWLLLLAFACFCLHLLAFACICLHLLAFACICLLLGALGSLIGALWHPLAPHCEPNRSPEGSKVTPKGSQGRPRGAQKGALGVALEPLGGQPGQRGFWKQPETNLIISPGALKKTTDLTGYQKKSHHFIWRP